MKEVFNDLQACNMENSKTNNQEKHLRVFENKSEYYSDNNLIESFNEGVVSEEAKKRIKLVKDSFSSGFLDHLIKDLLNRKAVVDLDKVSPIALECLNQLVDKLTSEVGRALIGLSVMQLCIKTIAPTQNVRLHKGSSNKRSFSWVEGISMRTLDKNYVTPVLRKYALIRLNADGFMMTRSLAENYPYTYLYKANLRGARDQWLILIEELEFGRTDPEESLKLLLSRLLNAAQNFKDKADILISTLNDKINNISDRLSVINIILKHSEISDYAARLLEVNMHALMQAAVSLGAFDNLTVKPLSQMRSANKKHGNIGDIELLENNSDIIISWDAKYGKGYLREEIEESLEKIHNHNNVETVGFVTTVAIERQEEIRKRIDDIQALYSVNFEVLTLKEWVDQIFEKCLLNNTSNEKEISQIWIKIYCEYLGHKRREQAPIDEPCIEWVEELTTILNELS